ncbi:MAG: hypothetical protein ACRDYU_05515 [Actinomycetes bacterium]
MLMTGHYRFALRPDASAPAFENHLTTSVIPEGLQLTRVTSGFRHRLLRVTDARDLSEPASDRLSPQYVWEATVTLVQGGYDFDQNIARLQDRVAEYATLVGVDAHVNAADLESDKTPDVLLIGHYRFALHRDCDAEAFRSHLVASVFTDSSLLHPTRITKGFSHRLLLPVDASGEAVGEPADGLGAQYVWAVWADLVNDMGYDFQQNAGRIQARVTDFATLVDVGAFTHVADVVS